MLNLRTLNFKDFVLVRNTQNLSEGHMRPASIDYQDANDIDGGTRVAARSNNIIEERLLWMSDIRVRCTHV